MKPMAIFICASFGLLIFLGGCDSVQLRCVTDCHAGPK